ncbi:unnamed protein product [Withania somnifera]
MLAKLKVLALDPCDPNVSREKIRPLWKQILKLRDVMALSDNDIFLRKRKLQQFVKDQYRFAGLPAEKSNQKSASKLSRRHFSYSPSISCFACNSLTRTLDNIQEQLSSEFSLHNDVTDFGPKGFSSLVDSDESINGSDLLSRDNRTPSVASLATLDDVAHSSSLISVKGTRSRPLQTPQQSSRLLNFIADHLQRFVIPVGPRFQADVQDWNVSADKDNTNYEASNSENSRWLGTRVWPNEIGSMKVSSRAIGKGRPHSCSCRSPGTAVCIKRHVSEERLILRLELGPAFFSWKFDEMGEQASKAWSLKEEATFESLVKRKSQLNGKNFLKHALKSLPHKTKETIINYYFNVFIPRQLSLQNKSPNNFGNINDDIADDINDKYLHKRSEDQRREDLKSQYLCRLI